MVHACFKASLQVLFHDFLARFLQHLLVASSKRELVFSASCNLVLLDFLLSFGMIVYAWRLCPDSSSYMLHALVRTAVSSHVPFLWIMSCYSDRKHQPRHTSVSLDSLRVRLGSPNCKARGCFWWFILVSKPRYKFFFDGFLARFFQHLLVESSKRELVRVLYAM